MVEQRGISIHRIGLDLVASRIQRLEQDRLEPEQVRDLGRDFSVLRRGQEILPVIVRPALVRPDLLGGGIGRAAAAGVASREIEDVESVDVVSALPEQTLDKLFPLLVGAQVFGAQHIPAAVPLAQELVARFSGKESLQSFKAALDQQG